MRNIKEVIMGIIYEWDVETVCNIDGDILDHHHADTVKELACYVSDGVDEGQHYELALVRDDWDDVEGLRGRSHWYPDRCGEAEFDNGKAVPKKYQRELKKNWDFSHKELQYSEDDYRCNKDDARVGRINTLILTSSTID
jgi:hypothetical protein